MSLLNSIINAKPNAFCNMPVADLIGTSMKQAQRQKLPVQSYEQQPLSDNPGDHACNRLSQLLLNEQVEILEKQKKEYKIKIFHWYHQAGTPPKKQVVYWVDKSTITEFDKLKKNDLAKIPQPILFTEKSIPHDNLVTLTSSFYDKQNRKTYSAGTRFVKTKKQLKNKNISVFSFNKQKNTFKTISLPQSICIEKHPTTDKGKRKLFVKLLKEWAYQENGYIPYILGGASIGTPGKFKPMIKKVPFNKKNVTLYDLPEKQTGKAKYGIDCAHLIARAAQIAGIKYFVKNTTTLKQKLIPLMQQEKLETGDILVWKGHTAVVSDAQKGLLIEARGYNHDYGKVQEIPFHEQFKGIKTSKQLTTAYLNKVPIGRLNKAGKNIQTIYDLKIMKLPLS